MALLGASITDAILSVQDACYTRGMAETVVCQAGAATPRQKVLALRNYLRKEVHIPHTPGWMEDRPFLRQSAAETLQTHEGWCGEETRAFIVMADAVGVRAQRLNLYGEADAHVVAEADLGCDGKVIVDCQQPPHIAELTPLDEVVGGSQFKDYSTLNLRRVGLGSFVPRLKLSMGAVGYWVERPHMLRALFWAALALGLVTLKGLRSLVRWLLHRRGWIHASDQARLQRLWQNGPAEEHGLSEPRP
jgi:hypothetical protein